MLHKGYVTNIDNNGRVRVKFPELNGMVSDYLPVIKSHSKNDKDGNFLEIDEEVYCAMDEHCEDGIVLGAYNTDSSPLPINDRNKKYYTFSDGTHIEYDKSTHTLTADVKGIANIKAKTVVIDGDLIVNGNVSDKAGTMQKIRDTYNTHDHAYKDGTTQVPGEKM